MNVFPPDLAQTRRQRPRWRRIFVNVLLLPPALLYVIVEHVFWAGAKSLLREAARTRLLNTLQQRVQKLPAAAVLPLFLIPEIFSHLGGLWATVLLVRRKYLAAMVAGLFIKGFATLLTVWIYQSCAPALLSVAWFARLHGKILQGRDWLAERTKPARLFARRIAASSRSGIVRRFRALRALIAARLGVIKK
jgi:hypothetical protein